MDERRPKGKGEVKKFREAIRVCSLELKQRKETRERFTQWREIAGEIRRLHNYVWRQWVVYHETHGTPAVVVDYMQRARQWHRESPETRGEKPRCAIEPWPAEFAAEVVRAIGAQFPGINSHVFSLALQKLRNTLITKNGLESAFKWWMEVLAGDAAIPSFTRELPIPFDKKRTAIMAPDGPKRPWRLRFRLDRWARPSGSITSTEEDVEVIVNGHDVPILKRLAEDALARKGCNLMYVPRKKKWFAQLGYQLPKAAEQRFQPGLCAVLRPCEDHPLILDCGDQSKWIGGRGVGAQHLMENIDHVLKRNSEVRKSRNECYRHTPSRNSKGHGRQRAHGWSEVLTNKRNRITKEANYQCRTAVLRWLESWQCGQLTLMQPSNDDPRWFLNRLGGWPWFQLKTLLEQKCKELGIAFRSETIERPKDAEDEVR